MSVGFMLKDHSRDHQVARDNITANMDLVNKYTTDVQHGIAELQELLTAISWYLADTKLDVDKHYQDAPIEHLTKLTSAYSSYAGELVNMETTIRQCLYVINRRFNVEDPEISTVMKRIVGDR
jgi:hypothetical protein